MNVRLKKDFVFSAGVIFNDNFFINHYAAQLKMMTVSNDTHEQNVAYERVKYWIDNILDSSILIPSSNQKIMAFTETGQRLVTLPEEPVDQVIGIMLYCKLNAITEGKLIITDVEISSQQGDNMIYLHNESENLGPFGADGWWQDSRPKCANIRHQPNDKIIELVKPPEWKDLGLDWIEDTDSDSTVVFADFKKNETE